jgi:predicted transposase/invertase (TIGR01784 family)
MLGISHESISQFMVTNPEMQPVKLGDKFCRLNINMMVDGQQVDLEIQVKNEGDYPELVLFNWAREYSTALTEGGDYLDLPRTVVISIINFKLFSCAEYHSEYQVLEVTRHYPLTDKMNLHFFELPKIPEDYSREDIQLLWLLLFRAETLEELEKIKALGVLEMEEAINAYNSITVSPEFRELERARIYARHNEASDLGHARREGEARGIEKGKKEIARNALAQGAKPEFVQKITGLDMQTITGLK